MPIVKVELSPGRTREQKEEYMLAITKLTSEILKCNTDSIDVVLIEVPLDNWCRAGKILG